MLAWLFPKKADTYRLGEYLLKHRKEINWFAWHEWRINHCYNFRTCPRCVEPKLDQEDDLLCDRCTKELGWDKR